MASPIAFLAGLWRGTGHGEFPTMDPFDYDEEVRFLDRGVPALMY
ncbi:MAG: heme-binding beta-barrel domain-containing protein, partial [Candidatus Rokuibacteriota bacterium]